MVRTRPVLHGQSQMFTYYSQNYAGIIGAGLSIPLSRLTPYLSILSFVIYIIYYVSVVVSYIKNSLKLSVPQIQVFIVRCTLIIALKWIQSKIK